MSIQNEREALAAQIEGHIEQEEEILHAYHALSDKLPDGLLGVLVNHIVTEEEMHHFLLQGLVEWLRDPAASEASREAGELADLLAQTQKLREHELESIDSFSVLAKRFESAGAETLAPLLEAIVLDSRKHHTLLGLIEKTISG